MYTSSEVGQTLTRADIWGKNFIMAKIDYSPTPVEAKQTLGATFIPSSPQVGLAEFTYNWQTPGILPDMGKNVTMGYMADDKILDATCGCLVASCVA